MADLKKPLNPKLLNSQSSEELRVAAGHGGLSLHPGLEWQRPLEGGIRPPRSLGAPPLLNPKPSHPKTKNPQHQQALNPKTAKPQTPKSLNPKSPGASLLPELPKLGSMNHHPLLRA